MAYSRQVKANKDAIAALSKNLAGTIEAFQAAFQALQKRLIVYEAAFKVINEKFPGLFKDERR